MRLSSIGDHIVSEADKVGEVLPDSLKRFYAQSDWQESKDKINPRWSEWYKQLCRDDWEREKQELERLIRLYCAEHGISEKSMNERLSKIEQYDRVEIGSVLREARKACRWMG